TDIWQMDLARGDFIRFTFDAANDNCPVWSPDATRIAFQSNRKGAYSLYVKPSGAGAEELLLESLNNEGPLDWSKDGRFLPYFERKPKTGFDLWGWEMTGKERKSRSVANSPFDERNGQFSPDGRWVAYQTNESGRHEIVVQPFPEATGKWQVSTSGGTQPLWRA